MANSSEDLVVPSEVAWKRIPPMIIRIIRVAGNKQAAASIALNRGIETK